ncbi:MAG TPA: ATP-binding protein [Spirochaetota bacterium]|nr:ATP-binding protein [Spirochaetota bacterium]HNT11119.1 ATP-binding protein [Spirochaetota bacterium]
MFNTIGNKIIVSVAVLIAALIGALSLYVDARARDNHLHMVRRVMAEKADLLGLFLSDGRLNRSALSRADAALMADIARIGDMRITVIARDGRVLADTEVADLSTLDNHRYRAEVMGALETGSGESVRYSDTLKANIMYYAELHHDLVVRVAKPLADAEASLARLRRAIVVAGLSAILLTVAGAFVLVRRVTRPVRETIAFAERFSAGDFSHRILNYNDDEIGTLQKALNRMADTIIEKMNGLILEQKKLQVTIESITDGIAVIDHSKRVLIANRAFLSLLDIRAAVFGRAYYEVVRGSSFNAKIEYSLARGVEARFMEALASGRYCEVFISPITEEKAVQGILIVLHDITEKRHLEELKTDLVGNLSHELKTPIAILRGYLETVSEHLNNPALCRELVDKALTNVDRQSSIVSDMVKLNMIETLPELPMEEVNPARIIEGCVEILQPKAGDRNIALARSLADVDVTVRGNRFLAEEVFFNIIDNAINYNVSDGTVRILGLRDQAGLVVTVADTGIGIPAESLPRLFERFYRVDKSRSRATGGTGLGLSIVKHAAEIMGWRVEASSDGTGTTFTVRIA